MANDVEEFVLQYEVESEKAEKKLDELQKKVKETNKEAKESKSEFKKFSEGAISEIGKVVPVIEKANAGISKMGSGLVFATVSLGLLAFALKKAADMRKQLEEQRLAGIPLGISGTRVEEYQRKIERNSQGRVNREQALEGLNILRNRQRESYLDPTRMNEASLAFKMAGVEVGKITGQVRPFNDVVRDLSINLGKMPEEGRAAVAKLLGISNDMAETMGRLGGEMAKFTEMSDQEIITRARAEESVKKFNTTVTQLSSKWDEFGQMIGNNFDAYVLPFITRALDAMLGLFDVMPTLVDEAKKWLSGLSDWILNRDEESKNGPSTYTGRVARDGEEPVPATEQTEASLAATLREKFIKDLDAQATKNMQTQDKFQQAVNMFGGAVSGFAGALDERQAWAAWAGEIGRSVGIGSNNGPTTTKTGVGPSSVYQGSPLFGNAAGSPATVGAVNNLVAGYGRGQPLNAAGVEPGAQATPSRAPSVSPDIEAQIQASSAKHGVDVDLIKKVIYQESRYNPNAKSEAGAEGLMQLMPEIQKAYGISDPYDTRQNIDGGTRLLAENLKRTNGDVVEALKMYHAGPNKSGWGPKTNAYPALVLGAPIGKIEEAKKNVASTSAPMVGGPIQQAPMTSGINDYGQAIAKPSGMNAAGFQNYPSQPRGESIASTQYMTAANIIADKIGVTVGQVMRGEIGKGDVEFAYKNSMLDAQKERMAAIGAENAAITPFAKQAAQAAVNAAESKIQQLAAFGPKLLEQAPSGDRAFTVGKIDYTIAVYEQPDGKQFSQQLIDHTQEALGAVANNASTGQKY